MNRRAVSTYRAGLIAALFFFVGSRAAQAAFTPRGSPIALTMSVTIGANGGGSAFQITASTLPARAFFGANAMVPVTITSLSGPIDPNNLRVQIVYQLKDETGALVGLPFREAIQFLPGAAQGNTMSGTAVVSRDRLAAIQFGGDFEYMFSASRVGSGTASVLDANGPFTGPENGPVTATPFRTSIVDQFCSAVSPAGSRVSAPSLSVSDGQTSVIIPERGVTSNGTLCIRIENNSPHSVGPNNTQPAAIYNIELQNTSLVAPAQLVLNYPSDLQGKVLGSGADPKTLGLYWLDEQRMGGDWRVISRVTVDTTLHTVTGQTGHFSHYGLFPAGAIGAAQLRPAERIITPNGDGINDQAVFGTGITEVKIFDVRGRRVKSIPGPAPAWDGTDDGGGIVESGVYIYQYTSDGDLVSGVIGVAK